MILTIDQRLQRRAEELLAGAVGAAVAMDPNTGEILAMASTPSFDQNDFVGGMSHEQWRGLITNPDRPKGRGRKLTAPPIKDLARELGFPVVQPQNF